jgi:hypothetical protein
MRLDGFEDKVAGDLHNNVSYEEDGQGDSVGIALYDAEIAFETLGSNGLV